MTGVSFTYDDKEVTEALERVAAVGGNTTRVLAAWKSAMLSEVQERFQQETGPGGVPWTPLSPRTAKQRIGRGIRGFQNILRVSGKLFRSITGVSDETVAEVGTNYLTAAVHQEGATIKKPARSATIRLRKVRGRTRFASKRHKRAEDRKVQIPAHSVTIPARPYLGFDPELIAELKRVAEDEIALVTGAEQSP